MTAFLWIIGVLILLLLIPVRIQVDFDETLGIKVGALWFSVDVYPKPKQPQKMTKKKQTAAVRKEKKKPPLSRPEELTRVLGLLGKCISPVRKLLRRTTLAVIHVRWVIAMGDAAQTAIAFGKASTAAYNAITAADGLFRVRVEHLSISPDFIGEKSSCTGRLRLSILPLAVLVAAADIGVKTLMFILGSIPYGRSEYREKEKSYGTQSDKRHSGGISGQLKKTD